MAVADQAVGTLGKVLKLRSDIGDELLAIAYLRWQREGLLPVIFHDNPTITLRQFLEWHHQPGMEYLGCFAQNPTLDMGPELAGLGWINHFRKVADVEIAEVGIAYFRKTPPAACAELCRMLLEYCFDEKELAAIYGVTPAPNRALRRFALRVGFKLAGPLPKFAAWFGQAADAYIYSMSREQWESLNGRGRSE